MPDYSNLRNMSLGGNGFNVFKQPSLLNLGDNPSNLQSTFNSFEKTNPFTVGSFSPIKPSVTNVGNTQTDSNTGTQATGVGSNLLNVGKSLIGSVKNGGMGYDMLSQGMSLLSGFMGSNVENSDTYNQANSAMDTLGSIVGMVNPIAGLGIKGVQTGLNLINNLGGKRADSYSIDQDTRQYMGSGYQGSYGMMDEAQNKAGKKYGLFNRSARKRANRMIAEAKRQENIIQNINEENQDYLAMGDNQLNMLNYTNELNGGLDFRYMRAAKVGIKLDLLNRTRKIQTKEVINLNTKQLDEFVPIITPAPIDKFKDGGVIQEEFVPIITEAPKLQQGGSVDKFPEDYIKFINSVKQYAPNLGDLKPKGYNMFRYWELQGKPLDWEQALNKNMFFKADDGNYHAPSVAWNEKGEGEWMKHKTFPTAWMEKAFYDGYEVVTDEKGNPLMLDNQPEYEGVHPVLRRLVGDAAKESENIRYNYDIADDGYGNLKYIPKKHKQGGSIEESDELVKLEDTNQKNIIPGGALHKNKHHMEHAEGLTSKGIPVIDNDGEQQAEIELDEIIFTLEVTKKLEKLYELYKNEESKDQAAIEAGKLLVQEILYNTDDKTGLIAKCEEGGKLQ